MTKIVALFEQSNISGANDVKMDETVLEEKLSFKKLGLSFSFKLDWGSCIVPIAKITSYEI